MILYHYTTTVHLLNILRNGFLKTVESNISERREHAGPDVVWLTDDPDLQRTGASWYNAHIVDKTEVRFTIETDAAVPWPVFARQHAISQKWYRILGRSGGDPSRWYVQPSIIWKDSWRAVDLRSGEIVHHRD